MRALRTWFPSGRAAAIAAAAAVVLIGALVAIPLVDESDDDETAGRAVESGNVGGTGPGEGTITDEGTITGEGPGTEEATVGGPGGSGGANATGNSTREAGSGGRTATETGVTADTIKLGMLILNVGNVERLGIAVGVNPEQQRQAWRAYIAEVNEAGGIHGRTIEPVFKEYDVTQNDSQRAACLAMTEDHKVFAVLDIALITAHALCVADEHETPLITLQPMPREAYAKSDGRLFTLFAEGGRTWRNVANDLHGRGALRGKTIGILGDTAPGNPETLKTLEEELGALGYKVAHRSKLASDGTTAQLPQAASQIPVEVQAMRRANVDLVLMATGNLTGTQFVQNADSQGYRPKYVVADWFNGYSDTYVQNMPDSFDGTLITTNRTGEFRTDRPEPETEKRCRSIYERRSGEKLDRSTIAYNSTLRLCTLLDVFVRGANAATVNLTRGSLSSGLQGLGQLSLSSFGGGSYRPGKFDAADLIRTARFDPECNCWVPADDFRSPRYT